eukprot:CAMPEP_0197454818 /NCGR_PEP_ID=MMETSP1175-20131217/38978_1 /TAXON_ID=1003142 /ORGANISM="Triceratium dubium, Strain CCMP147" /LENGTH=106 /DNA_ID=CAMNT_0042988509 /DNA_START=365 /DNA_END=681 /DNA_ORIENTATION=-
MIDQGIDEEVDFFSFCFNQRRSNGNQRATVEPKSKATTNFQAFSFILRKTFYPGYNDSNSTFIQTSLPFDGGNIPRPFVGGNRILKRFLVLQKTEHLPHVEDIASR